MTDPVILVVAGLAIIVLIGGVAVYNTLVSKTQMARNGWADIDVQLKRRADLIPKLAETVQAYAAHERNLFSSVAEERSRVGMSSDDPAVRSKAETALSRPLARLLALAEQYPDIKANTNFLELQKELSDTETRIEMARRFYNGAVRELNTLIESFPANLVAPAFGFHKRAYFEIDTAASLVPTISLSGRS